MNIKIISPLLACSLFFSCASTSQKVIMYDLREEASGLPFFVANFVSYKDVLFFYTFSRHDSSFINPVREIRRDYLRFDTAECQIIYPKTGYRYKLSYFSGDTFSITGQDSMNKVLQDSEDLPAGYTMRWPLRDTVMNGMPYYYADSSGVGEKDSFLLRFFFVKQPRLQTIYSVLNLNHEIPGMRYAGFIYTNLGNNFRVTHLIENIRKADSITITRCEAMYRRFKQLIR
jgi:hypothetical protein